MDDKQKIEWFEKAVKFQLEGMIFLTMKSRKGGVGSWAIEDLKSQKILNSNMEWEDEVPKSQRDESYMIRTRFDFDSASAMFEQYKMFAEMG